MPAMPQSLGAVFRRECAVMLTELCAGHGDRAATLACEDQRSTTGMLGHERIVAHRHGGRQHYRSRARARRDRGTPPAAAGLVDARM
jgi:hypothetical protein